MSVFPIGDQRVGIVGVQPVLDGDGNKTYTEFGEPITEEVVELVDGCCIEVQTMGEQQGLAVTTSEVAVVIMPEVDGHVPLVDEDGNPAGLKPVSEITSSMVLRDIELNRDYVMRGDAVLHRGQVSHIECRCEHQEG